MKEEFCYLLRVRYAECDAQKVVFNAKYVEYIDMLLKMGNTSFTLQLGFYNYQTKTTVAIGKITYVMVNGKDHTKMAIPADMRVTLEQGAPGVLVNHSGIEIK